VVHVNAEFADQASDHDPTVVRLAFNSAPSVSAGGPYTVDEGGTVLVTASGQDPEGDAFTYAWDLDGDGLYDDAVGPTATFDASAVDGPATRTVSVQATDAFGATSTGSATVTVRNVPPTIDSVTPGAHVGCGAASSLMVAWHDPAPADTFVVQIAWGDGSTSSLPAASSPLTASHSYATAGPHSVSVTVRDDDAGTSAAASATLVVDYTVLGGGLLAPWSGGSISVNAGSKVPLKVSYAACNGSRPANLAPTYTVTASTGGPVLASGSLRWDGDKYVGQLDTSSLPGRGTYTVTVTVPSTGQKIVGTLRVR
jgi:hypothetical protein